MSETLSQNPRETKPLCPYCARPISPDEREVEHTFPESWYFDGTTQDQMLKVDACRSCNHAYHKVEDRVLPTLLMCVDETAASKKLSARMRRSMNPGAGRNESDAAKRAHHLQKFTRKVKFVDAAEIRDRALDTKHARNVWWQTSAGLLVRGALGVTLGDDEEFMIGKLVRGAYFHEQGKPLAPPIRFEVVPVGPGQRDLGVALIRNGGNKKFTAAFEYACHIEGNDSTWLFGLWGELFFYAFTGGSAALLDGDT